ncbi:MAG: thiamine pyrophosphate-binding protein [Steroidobacteraceae bacterium]
MSPARNGADAICAALRVAGVDTVFGVPGTQTVTLYEALRAAGIRTITATHELAATFMAQGYYRSSNRLAAVSTIPGPGFAFTLAALAEAHLDSAAVVLLTGSPRVCNEGRRRSQAIDQATMAGPVVKEVFDVAGAAQVREVVSRACRVALADEPGPVLVQFEAGVLGESDAPYTPVASAQPGQEGDASTLIEAARFIATAGRVLIYAGQGASGVAAELRRVADVLGAVVATTPSGRGVVPEDDARLLPLDATGDLAGFNSVAAECDAILVIGAALGENGSVGFGLEFASDRLVRVDTSADVLARPPSARWSVVASAGDFLAAVLDVVTGAGREATGRGFDDSAARAMRSRLTDRRAGGPSDARIGGGDARDFFAALRRGIPADGCLVLDSGMHQLLARRHHVVKSPRGMLFPSDFQSMAFGLPAAIGAKLAQPDRAVVALIGDGGFRMTGLELGTAVGLGLALPVIVFDDGVLGLIRLDQLLAHGRAHATELGGLDYEAMALAVGCAHARAGIGEIEKEIGAALRRRVPTLIVVPVKDAPALRRARTKLRLSQAAKSLLGGRLVGALRSLKNRCGSN